jgi:general secretion pathway protein F
VTRPGAKRLALRALARVPRVGARLRLLQLARMYRTLGMLLRSGIPIVQALGMTRELMQGSSLPAYDRACARIREGVAISIAFADAQLTTPVAARMLRVGEQTGNMGGMMENLAELFDEDNARALEIFSRAFEPVLMALIGLVIGSIVVLMYLPIFDLASNIP